MNSEEKNLEKGSAVPHIYENNLVLKPKFDSKDIVLDTSEKKSWVLGKQHLFERTTHWEMMSDSERESFPYSAFDIEHVEISTDGMGKGFIKDLTQRGCVHINSVATVSGELKPNDIISLLPSGLFEYKVEHYDREVVSSISSSFVPVKKRPSEIAKGKEVEIGGSAKASPGDDFEIIDIATSPKKKSKLERDLMAEVECPICFCPLAYSFMVPCQHTFCYECLKDHAVACKSLANKENFTCPVCSKPARLKDCTPNLKVDNLVDLLVSHGTSGECRDHRLRCEYGKELYKNPNTSKKPPKLTSEKSFIPSKTTNADKVAREQKRAARRANRPHGALSSNVVLDLTGD